MYNGSVFGTDDALRGQLLLDSYLDIYDGLCNVKKVLESSFVGSG